jgi:hypothetical protein
MKISFNVRHLYATSLAAPYDNQPRHISLPTLPLALQNLNTCFFIVALQHNLLLGRLFLRLGHHIKAHHTPYDSSGWVNNPSRIPLLTKLKRDTSVPSAGFEHSILAVEWPQTYALYLKATRIGEHLPLTLQDLKFKCFLNIYRKLLLYLTLKSELTVYHSEEWSYCVSQWRVNLLFITLKSELTVYHSEEWTYCISQWRVNLLYITMDSELTVYHSEEWTYCISQWRVILLYITVKSEFIVYHTEEWTYCVS